MGGWRSIHAALEFSLFLSLLQGKERKRQNRSERTLKELLGIEPK